MLPFDEDSFKNKTFLSSYLGLLRSNAGEDNRGLMGAGQALQEKQRSFMSFGFSAEAQPPPTTTTATQGIVAGNSRRESQGPNVNVTPTTHDMTSDTPEIRKYKKRFNSEILCAALWGVNLLIGTENGLMLLDRSGQVSSISRSIGNLNDYDGGSIFRVCLFK
jgi:hypothetical protein